MKFKLVHLLKSIGFPISVDCLNDDYIFPNDNQSVIFFDVGHVNFKLTILPDCSSYVYILSAFSPIDDDYSIILYRCGNF